MRAIEDIIRKETYKSMELRKHGFATKNKDRAMKIREEQQKAWNKREWFIKLSKAMRKGK